MMLKLHLSLFKDDIVLANVSIQTYYLQMTILKKESEQAIFVIKRIK